MLNFVLTLIVLVSLWTFGPTATAQTSTGVRFSFTLSSKSTTSAGVFAKDGTLIRTLWSGVPLAAGTFNRVWDGKDDRDKAVAPGSYDVRVLTSNTTYHWDGLIGNTSKANTGSTKHKSLEEIHGMVVVGNTAYCSLGYSEGWAAAEYFKLTDSQSKSYAVQGYRVADFMHHVATDGTTLYWGSQDPFAKNKWFIVGTQVADNAQTKFANGRTVNLTRGASFNSTIDYLESNTAQITGVAVQKTGSYLFVAHRLMNELHVLNKTTGALVRTISMSAPREIFIDGENNLWAISGTGTVSQYDIQSDGTLSAAKLTLTGLVAPLAVAVSPDNKTVLVADGGTSQQVKAYNNSTGQSLWTLGQEGGYASNATVSDVKFMFEQFTASEPLAFIAFAPDGSFWLGDSGNCRALRFGTNRTVVDRIMFLPKTYNSTVDSNDPTRVFAGFLEFKVDYSKPLAPNNGSWTFVRNWYGQLGRQYNGQYRRLRFVHTLQNGRTYGFVAKTIPSNFTPQLVELPKTGVLRFTGFELNTSAVQLYGDGSLRKNNRGQLGAPSTWTIKQLTGFDANNNPQWGPEATIASTPNTTQDDPVFCGIDFKRRTGEVTSSNVVVTFDATLPNEGSKFYHLGGIKAGTNKWLWRTATPTHKDYAGVYPEDGAYEIGNNVQYGGSNALVTGRHIIWGYHGEYWQGGQTNKYTHVYDDGLMVNTFGTTTGAQVEKVCPPGMAGNSFAMTLITDESSGGDRAYLYHNDEGFHSALHRWSISGLNSVREQTIPITLSSTPSAVVTSYEGIDLLAGLPFNQVLGATTAGWTRNPVAQNLADRYYNYWNVRTSLKSYLTNDVLAQFANASGGATVSRDLGTVSASSSWQLRAKIGFWNSMPNYNGGGSYFEVLDNAGKTIAQFYLSLVVGANSQHSTSIYGNKTVLATGTKESMAVVVDRGQLLDIQVSSAGVRFQYATYPAQTVPMVDPAANWKAPKTVRMRFTSGGANFNYMRAIDIESLRLFVNTTYQVADLNLNLQTDKRVPRVGEATTFLVKLQNSSTDIADSVVQAKWSCQLPPNLDVISHEGMSYENGVLSGTVSNLASLTDTVFVFKAVPKEAGTYRTTAQIVAATLSDPDSTPDTGTDDGEDDTSEVDIRTDQFSNKVYASPNSGQFRAAAIVEEADSVDSGLSDLSLSMTLSNRVPAVNDVITCFLTIQNQKGQEASNIQIEHVLPEGIEFVDGDNWSAAGNVLSYTVNELYTGTKKVVPFRVRVKSQGNWIMQAQIMGASTADPDSIFGNGCTNGEDDQAQTDLRVR